MSSFPFCLRKSSEVIKVICTGEKGEKKNLLERAKDKPAMQGQSTF